MPKLQGRIAIVTGASAGIGAATARLFAAEGARLVLNARRKERLEAVAGEIGAIAVTGDVTEPAVRAALVEAAGGRVDLLVNNAGYGEPGPVELVPEEAARRQLEVNLFAAAALARAVLPLMRRQRSGRILNVSSIAGRMGYPLFGWYCASKHALEGLSDALRFEARPFGIRVCLIEPGPIATEFFDVARARSAPLLLDQHSPYRPLYEQADEIEARFRKQAVPAQDAARVLLRAATASRPKARYAVHKMAKATMLALRLLPRGLVDRIVRRQFRVPKRM
ncbi:MAG: SDR family NAD(P)-dependent oxidoreductase [Planctomycetaceae bacterium]